MTESPFGAAAPAGPHSGEGNHYRGATKMVPPPAATPDHQGAPEAGK